MNKDLKEQIKKYFVENYKRVKIEDNEDLIIYFFDLKTQRDYKFIFQKDFMNEPRVLLVYKLYNLMNSYILNSNHLFIDEVEYVENVIKASINTLNKYCIIYETNGGYVNIN